MHTHTKIAPMTPVQLLGPVQALALDAGCCSFGGALHAAQSHHCL